VRSRPWRKGWRVALSNAARPIVPRGKLWKNQRSFVVARDRGICQYCEGDTGSGRRAHADHVRPLKHGGEDALWNYVCACETCNKSKGGKWPAAGAPDIVIGKHGIRALYESRKANAAALEAGAAAPGAPAPEWTIENVAELFNVPIEVLRALVASDPMSAAEREAETVRALDEIFPLMLEKTIIRDNTGKASGLAIVPDFRDITAIAQLRDSFARRLPAAAGDAGEDSGRARALPKSKRRRGITFEKEREL
jgi:hypothetical protein